MKALLALPQFDEVWVMPSGSRADKTIAVSDAHRLAMLQLVRSASFANDRRLVISDFELQLPRPSETRRTLAELHTAYPGTDFWFALGGDSYHSLLTWPGAEEFADGLPMVVFTADDVPEVATGRALRIPLPPEFDETSSTLVRDSLSRQADAASLVSPAIMEYAARHRLY